MLNYELVLTFILVFARISAFVVAAPLFGGSNTPAQVKAGMSFVVSLIIVPLVLDSQMDISGGLLGISIALFREIGVGLLTGLICNMILQVLNIVGQIFDLHIGFLMSNFFDPSIGGQITLTAKFLYLTGIVLFFTLDGHHMVLAGLVKSFEIVPLNKAIFNSGGMTILVKAFTRMISVAVQISAPLIAIMLIVDICLGLVARTAPQMNVFMLGFSIKIGLGILTLAVMIPLLGVVFQSLFRMMERDLYTVLKGLV